MSNATTKTLTDRQQRAADRKASAERIARAQAETRAIVESGVCPHCGSGIKYNLALTGWVMCEQKGASGFRKDATKAACDWQGFTR